MPKAAFRPSSALKPYAPSFDRVIVCWSCQCTSIRKAGMLLRKPRTIVGRWTVEGKWSFDRAVVYGFLSWAKFKRVCPRGLTRRAGISYFSNNCLMLLLNASVTKGNRNEKDVTRGSLLFRGLFLRSTALLTVKLQIFVWYLFSYFRLETGSYVLIFVLSRVCEENDVEIQWLQGKKKFSYDIKFRTFSKVWNVRK